MSRPRVTIVLFPGTNGHEELAEAFRLAGGDPHIVPIYDLVSRNVKLSETDLIGFAGGFSYGDHFRSGVFAANDLLTFLRDELELAQSKNIPMFGVCNGFQILVETGLLPGDQKIGTPTAVLDQNRSAKFEHWTERTICFKSPAGQPCVWLTSLNGYSCTVPVSHGEGRLVPETSDAYNIVATYGTPEGDASPNGSPIAGICSPNGLIMGMMPHAERRVDSLRGGDQGLPIFITGVNAVR